MTGVLAGAAVRPARRHALFHPLRVAAIQRLTRDAVCISFAVPPELADEFSFVAGQHVSVRLPALGDDVRRNYSICSPATERGLRIAVKQIPGGEFSAYAAERLRPGDVLDVMTPSGTFTVTPDPTRARRYAAIAAGSGITPVLSMLATALEVEPDSTAALIYVNRRVSTIMFLDELEDLKDRYPQRFQLIHVLGEESTEVELLSGRLDARRLGRILDTLVPVEDVDEWYLCGPLALTDMAREELSDRGVVAGRVHRELFHVGATPPRIRPASAGGEADTGAQVVISLDGRSSVLTVPRAGESILEAALRVRPDAPFACKNAVCGTCRARVIEGAVEMDSNYALESDELAGGYVLTCQSHPTTDRVVVDYDH
jgi:ring-1,2-phenylacetyl-CoA epoxidase subunit PaaE